MSYSTVDKVVDTIDAFFFKIGELFGGNPARYIDLVTADSPYTLATDDGSLLTGIDLRGFSSLCGDAEFQEIVTNWFLFWKNRLGEEGGHELHWYHEIDPDAAEYEMERRLKPARAQARRMGLNVDDLFDEKVQSNIPYVHSETSTLVIVTKLSALPERERNAAVEERIAESKGMGSHSPESQKLGQAIPALREIHSECVNNFLEALEKWGFDAHMLNSGALLQEAKSALYGRERGRKFWPQLLATGVDTLSEKFQNGARPVLEGQDRLTLRQPDPYRPGSRSSISPRPIPEQLLDSPIDSLDEDRYLHVGQRFVAPVQVVRHTKNPRDFDSLVRRLKQVQIPVRIAFHLTPNGLASRGFASALAGFMSFTGPVNASIARAYDKMRKIDPADQAFPGFSITATTWAPARKRVDPDTKQVYGDLSLIQRRAKQLIDALDDWGEVSANQRYGDAAEIFFSTCPALTVGHNTVPCPAPLTDVFAMAPLTRIAPAWHQGTYLMRTNEGQIVPYEQFSGLQKSWITALVGPQGTGKSTQMFLLNFYYLVQPSSETSLPFLRAIDFQESQRGLVDLIRAGLPRERLHEAQFTRWENSEEFASNIFDLMLGLDDPLPEHRRFLTSFLSLIVQSLTAYDSRDGLIGAIISEAYRYYRNDPYNNNAKRFSPGAVPEVDEAILKYGIHAERDITSWYEIRDALFDQGEVYLATLAQRRSMPIMEDLPMIAATEAITTEYTETIDKLPVTELFARGVREALEKYRFLRGYTQFSMSQTRVGFLDLAGMVTKGISKQDAQDNAIVMFAAMRMLASDFWYNDDDLHHFKDPRYKAHATEVFNNIQSVPKRFGSDEIHRFANISEANDMIDQINAEGRKNLVDILLATQQLMTHTETTRKLATTVVICGLGSKKDMVNLKSDYDFNPSEINAISSLKGPGKAGGNAVYRFVLKTGKEQVVSVFSTEGPKMLWAAATEQVDRTLRRLLYKRMPQEEARRRLALCFPGGSVKSEVEERQRRLGEDLDSGEDLSSSIIMQIVEELCDDRRFGQERLAS